MRRHPMTLAFALLVVSSFGCTEPLLTPDLSSVGSITVDVNTPSMSIGQTAQVAATVVDVNGHTLAGRSVTWASSAPAVASVSPDGIVSALSSGSATIQATAGGVTGQSTIAVGGGSTTPPPTTPPPSTTPSTAELPRVMLETSMPAAPGAGGTVISVPVNGDLQAAIDQAKPGDVIELAPGAVFTGNFTLPNKGVGTGWIVIRPALPAGALPVESRRMTPQLAAAANLPRIESPNQSPAIQTAAGAHHYRFVGLEVALASAQTWSYGLITLGTDGVSGQTTLASVPHDLVLDRMYIHGTATATLRRCVALNSASSAVIDSYLSDCHESGADSQAISGWNGPGPFKIVNNYLEAAGEVIMFGGSDPGIQNLVPSDIEVRHNHLTRPLAWKPLWLVKNIFELKNATRVLVEGNVMENNWLNGQDGTGVVLKSVNQSNTAPWSGTTNVTFRLNIIRNTGAGFLLAANPENKPCVPLNTVAITNNLILNINSSDYNGTSRGFLTQGNVTDLTISHNTQVNLAVGVGTIAMGPPDARLVRFTVTNNLFASPGNYGVYGDNFGGGGAAWDYYAPGGTLLGNVFAGTGSTGNNYPPGNFFATDNSSVGFTDLAGGDYSLSIISPYKGKATDGKDPGADMAALTAATNGVVLP